MAFMVGKEGCIGCGDLPIIKMPPIMVVAKLWVCQNGRKRLAAIVAGLPARTFESAAGGEFALGQLVLNQPETKFILMIVIGDGDIRICSRNVIVIG